MENNSETNNGIENEIDQISEKIAEFAIIEDEAEEKKEKRWKRILFLILKRIVLFVYSFMNIRGFQTIIIYVSFLMLGAARTAQGPSIVDLQEHVNATLEDFRNLFIIGSVAFPLGNYLGGYGIKYFQPLKLLASMMFLLAVINTVIPFSYSLSILMVFFGLAELIMGIYDSICNVCILKIWGDNSGPFFTGLHLTLGVGNLIGPLMAELFLKDSAVNGTISNTTMANATFSDEIESTTLSDLIMTTTMSDMTTTLSDAIMNTTISDVVMNTTISDVITNTTMSDSKNASTLLTNLEHDQWIVTYHFLSLTELQVLHGVLGIVLSIISLIAIITHIVYKPSLDNEKTDTGDEPKLSLIFKDVRYFFYISSMFIFSLVGNGIYFLVGNFITVHGMYSPLELTKSEGAQITALFFGCSVFAKVVAVIFVQFIEEGYYLIIGNLFFLTIGSWFLLFFGDSSVLLYQIGIGIVGLGIGTHFSSGIVWMTQIHKLSGSLTSLLLIATSVGAQIFKIPASSCIEESPQLFYYIILGGWLCILMTAVSAKFIISNFRFSFQKETPADKSAFRESVESIAGPVDRA